MKEAKIILPTRDNHAAPLSDLHVNLRKELAETFGRYTARRAYGGWVNDSGALIEEQVHEYVVTYDCHNVTLDAKLIELATRYGKLAKQDAIYVRTASGRVAIIDTK